VTPFPKIISADDHLVEPPHLWTDRLPRKFEAVGPRVVRERGHLGFSDGEQTFELSDEPSARWADVWHYEDSRVVTTQGSAAVGFDRDALEVGRPVLYDEMRPGLYQPEARLADMDIAGVEASLCFPNVFVRFCGQQFLWAKDKDLALLCVHAYNDFVAEEWAAESNGRLIPCGIVPLWDAELAAAEVRRSAGIGIHAVTFSELPPYLGLPSIYGDYWDPFFQACEEVGTVVMVHVGSSSKLPMTSPDAPLAVIHALPSNNAAAAMVDWICAAMPVRFPEVKLVMAESNIGWIPYFLERLDALWEHSGSYTGLRPRLGNPPSTYFRSNIFCTFFSDAFGLRQLDDIGEDNVMFEVDYPHGDSNWPESTEVAKAQTSTANLGPAVVEKVVRRNAIRVFGLDMSWAQSDSS
jgi:predicted TIM-barrel fold metal-dependent hydrolase